MRPIDGLVLSNTLRTTLDAWIVSISKDLIEYNITFNTIIPGKINTNRLKENNKKFANSLDKSVALYEQEMKEKIPAKRFGEPDEIAHTVLLLCTEKTSYITANKIKIDGGLTL